MRIVVDMQGAQTESRFRGIGRYTLSFAQAIVRNRGEHEVFLALSGFFPDTIGSIRESFRELLPQENIRVWYAPGPVRECQTSNAFRRETAEFVREGFIASLCPNVVVVTSLFEGLGDDAVTSIGCFDSVTPTATILYDLIPLISPDADFKNNPVHIAYYKRKITSLTHSAALLAISDSSRAEALAALEFDPAHVVNISSGCDPRFHKVEVSSEERHCLLEKFGIKHSFLMYTGGADQRKNLHRLIRAFAALPESLREKSQLVMVGKMPEGNVAEYLDEARNVGLGSSDIVFTGFVTDLELMQLYSLCAAFVFPSLHEGFGLPPLEAMACGAPVITANVTSLPEVVGRADAMFDPLSIPAITGKIRDVLTDESFRQDLIRSGAEQVKKFSWDRSAEIAILVLEKIARPAFVVQSSIDSVQAISTGIFKPQQKRILVSKLDHMGDLVLAIPAIMKLRARYPYARIDALVGGWNLEPAQVLGVFDHIYTFDFFSKKSSEAALAEQDLLQALVGSMPRYDLAIDLRRQRDTRFILLKVPAKCYAGHASGDAALDARIDICLPASVDVPFVITENNRTSIAKQMLAVIDALPADVNDFIRLPVPVSQQLKNNGGVALFPKAGNDVKEWGWQNFQRLIELLEAAPEVEVITVFSTNPEDAQPYLALASTKLQVRCNLPYSELLEVLDQHTVCVANNSFGAHIASYRGLRVVGIYAGHETVSEWAPVFGDVTVIHRAVDCSPCHIAHRHECKNNFICLAEITPEFVFSTVRGALAGHINSGNRKTVDDLTRDLLSALAPKAAKLSDLEHIEIARCVAQSIQVRRKAKLFVDVSFLAVVDAKTGVQRVTRSILKCLLDQPPVGFDVVPVFAVADIPGYRHAQQFTAKFLGQELSSEMIDPFIEYQAGDVFLGLDLQPQVVPAQRETYQQMRRHGVLVKFVVHDLLPLMMPDCFPDGTEDGFCRWLDTVVESDGAICVSKATADNLKQWIIDRTHQRLSHFKIGWSHNGADIEGSVPTKGLPSDAGTVLLQLEERPSFLVVGTVEPRKGLAQTLAAFEKLWGEGKQLNLVILGKQGWHVEDLCDQLRKHPKFGSHLFWLEGISDEYLERIYASSTCLIAASFGEGFGLPLIEAAQHKLPIIARDIPVFREVAGEYAYYFQAQQPEQLAAAIENWLNLFAKIEHPMSQGMPRLTWQQSASNLLQQLLPEGVTRVAQ